MNSVYFRLIIIFLFSSCIENIPIKPIYTGDTDWVPEISLSGNGYKRFLITWGENDLIPVKVERNIEKLCFELSDNNGLNYQCIDSVLGVNTVPYRFESGDILAEGSQYSIRIRVKYRDGSEKISNTISFTAEQIPGEIIKRIYINVDSTFYPPGIRHPDTASAYHPTDLHFDNGYIYAHQETHITRIDTLSGEVALITDQLYNYAYSYYDNVVVKNDALYLHSRTLGNITKLYAGTMDIIEEIVAEAEKVISSLNKLTAED